VVGNEFRIVLGVLDRQKKNGARVAQIDFHSRFHFDFVSEFRVHAGAGGGQWLESGGGLERGVDQHASGSVGGFVAWLSALDDQDGGAAFAQGDGEREADDASADDDDVPGFHGASLKSAL